MGVSKGRVFNLISSLIDRGFIYRNENGKRMMNPKYVIPEDLEVITFRFKK
jgi:predicted transcriptional regulator